MILLDQVGKEIKKKHILKSVSTQINQGESIGIVGPNGAGKSTFIKLIATIIKPDTGRILYKGNPIEKSVKAFRKQVGYIPQDIALFEDFTVKEQLSFWKSAVQLSVSDDYVQNMMASLDLHSVEHQKVKELSGGWKRKVNVCVGMLHNPDILLLDEPTAGVDLAAKDDLIQWLTSLHHAGKTLLIISHDWDVINRLCEKAMVFQQGELIFHDQLDRLNDIEQNLRLDHNHQELVKILKQRMN
ncbi:ABC transporter ATP-binding protein [Salinibacillus xinjiangensis]|uniref:ATP-binding cassette domain-containing protein n=1 Tax=Salinibacillus xinjiangensis TaxID=1229268 RepID=A0A6G1X7H1_9BACI|nr:ABC transporter ATP-binding protein [Salinibacillus xinjiangensis]MRG86856.1 ATP-binding cassette domain-containing protein [Salinibacillus xinjiangensis]